MLPSTIKRFLTAWQPPHSFTTERSGSKPMGAVPHRVRPLSSPPFIWRSRGRHLWKEHVMPVKAGVIRARCAHHKAGRRRDLHRYRVPGSGDHCRGAVAPWRFGRYVHAGCMHGVALPPGWADALLFVRRRPHLLQRREAASAEPGRYGQYPAGYDALAWGSARSPVLASGGPGGSTGTSRAPLRQTRDAHCAARGPSCGLPGKALASVTPPPRG